MQRLFKRTTPIILSGLLALLGAACGDDDGGDGTTDSPGDDDDDGSTDDDGEDDDGDGDGPDAGGEPDAAPAVTRSATIAVTDTTITNPGLPGEPIQGAVVSMNFVDDQSVTVAPHPDFSSPLPIGTCFVTVYGEGDAEGASVDEGPVTVSGTASGDFACGFNAKLETYACQSTNPAIAGGVAGNAAGGTLELGTQTLILAKAAFAPEMQGMSIQLTGFGSQDGVYPIIQVVNDFTLRLAGLDAEVDGGAEATFTTFIGGPIPNAFAFDFLDDGTTPVVVSKEASDVVPAFEVTASARGEGFALADGSAQPHEIPATSPVEGDVVFSCGETCGAEPAPGTGQIPAMVLNGETTDGDVTKNPDPTFMPTATNYATFRCIGLQDEVPIPAAALEAILETNPTRIQTTVGRFMGSNQVLEDSGTTNVVVGHSLTGFTTVVAPPKIARQK